MAEILKRLRAELPRLASFGVIGVASLLLNLGLYALFTRILWPTGNRNALYAVDVVLVTLANYEANRLFTFDAKQRTIGGVGRFAIVAVIALALNSALFWFGHQVSGINDFVVIILNTLIVAFFTFSMHRIFTFHERPWRHFVRK